MLLSILDDNTFMVGDKTFRVGDEIEIDEIDSTGNWKYVTPWGDEVSLKKINDYLRELTENIRATREDLLLRLHRVQEEYDSVAAEDTLRLEVLEREWLYYSDVLFRTIQRSLGGHLPMIRDADTGKISVRERRSQNGRPETLNYLRDVCSARVQYHGFVAVRAIAMAYAKNDLNKVNIGAWIFQKSKVPVVSAENDEVGLDQWLEQAAVQSYDEVIKYGPGVGVVWNTDELVYFLNAAKLLRETQGDPKMALINAMNRCSDYMPTPTELGFFIYGNMPVKENSRGVLLSICRNDGSVQYKILLVGEDQTLFVAEEGDEAKLDDSIIDVAKKILDGKEE